MAIGLAAAAATAATAQPELLDGVAAIVNGKVITFSEVREYVQPAALQLRRDYSGEELREKVRAAQLDALNNLIDRQLILDEYHTKGYSLPDNIVDTQIDEIIATDFNNDRVAFVKTLQAENITLSQYRERLRERIIVQAMRNRKTQQHVIVSPYRIEKYYQDNLDNFRVDDQIKLRMIFIKKGAAPADDEADPQRRLAEELLAKLREGDSFESLARVYSQGREAKDGGDWGWIGHKILSPQLDEVAFRLKPGQHSDIVETADGYYLLYVEDVKPAHVRPLVEVRDEIERILLQQQRARMQEEWIQNLRAKAHIRLF
jgi:parvulin-like peptidyl-prolyl isomerase